MVKKIVFLFLSLILVQNFFFNATIPLEAKTKERAADFTLLDLKDQEVSLSQYKGKRIILFFWTTWCPYCRGELKQLNTMQQEFLKSGTQVLAINVEESAQKVRRFMERVSFSYQVLLDRDGMVARDYAILGVPTYVFIDREGGIISYNHYLSRKIYENMISR